MLLTTLWVDYPILREALSDAPGVTITWERSDITEGGDHQMLFWAAGDEFDAFETGLEADPTVTDTSKLVEFDERCFYRVELTPAGHRTSIYPNVVEEGGVPQEVTASHEGWYFRVAFPSDEALERFHAFFVENDLPVEVRNLYEKSESDDGSGPSSQYGVTDRQRETLIAAIDAGYLDIPRSCSLAQLGDRLDVSPNATSERFRRGVKGLIEQTVYPDDRSP